MLAALADIDVNVNRHAPTARRTGFLIEAMQPPPLGELMLSLRRDPTFGLVLTLASGGVLVELLDDGVTLLLPASDDVITAAIYRLAIARVLRGYRGAATADFVPLIGVINHWPQRWRMIRRCRLSRSIHCLSAPTLSPPSTR